MHAEFIDIMICVEFNEMMGYALTPEYTVNCMLESESNLRLIGEYVEKVAEEWEIARSDDLVNKRATKYIYTKTTVNSVPV